ncbi:dual specificity protein phosphatase CDC14AB-like [Microplitis demolitor]|uniref:dual specificity protein phosphatase CDC14AB-like n=1 Tax=Microplitis demolitor TaxID=69319 RepID=UPI0004CD0D8C|nr:dual specificity protein phosphatase CDC14AB-like [Microplitis demolitor]
MAYHQNSDSPKNNSTKISEFISHEKSANNNCDLNSIKSHPDINYIAEFIVNKFYFAILIEGKTVPRNIADVKFLNTDDEFIYHNFYNDFGPLNLGCLYKYCFKVNKILNNSRNRHKQIVHYCVKNDEKKANAAFLITSYAILYLNKYPKDAHKSLVDGNISLKPFQDASMGHSIYRLRLQDCLNALYKAVTFGFFNFDDFDISEYEKYEKVKNGDLNWIVPQKFLAFTGPSTEPRTPYHPPEHYYDYFIENNVNTIIRLNKESYDSSRFTRVGINHYDIYLPDGSVPSRKVLCQFLYIAEITNGPIAVHCKAGLGRTGSLICAYLIKHYKMTAKEAIAWARICRPGSVIGHQQTWLESMQKELIFSGQKYRLKHYNDVDKILHHKYGIYSITLKLERKNDKINDTNHKNNSLCKRKLYNMPTENKQKFFNFFSTNGSICDYLWRKLSSSSAEGEGESTSSKNQNENSPNSESNTRKSTTIGRSTE